MNYQELYENEREKCAELADKLALLETENEDLQQRLNKIKNSGFWKISKPARSVIHFTRRQKDRLVSCGSIKGVAKKVVSKRKEKKVLKTFGTESFPTPQQIEEQRNISILVPLWNTPKIFLTEMLDSVMNQTYTNWELCLADGSDAEHAYVGEICAEYKARSEGRIVYQKLAKNEGIAGNTNQCYKMATGEFIGLFDHDDILHPTVLFEYVKAINEQDADYLYCDEGTFKKGNINKIITMHFKPDYAPDNLRANNYICHFSVFSRELLEGTELFRTQFDGSQDHDMILRLTDNA